MNKQSEKRYTDISILRIIATLGVIFLHTNNTLTANKDLFSLSMQEFKFYTALWSLMQWAVPVFMMITGTLMLNRSKEYDWKNIVFNYSRRVVLALFIFGVPFSCLEMIMNKGNINLMILFKGVLNVLNGKSWGHLWYLYTLIGFYLVLPIMKLFVEHIDKDNYTYILILMFVFKYVIPIIDMIGLDLYFSIPIMADIVFYTLLGAYIYKYNCFNTIKKYYLFVVVLICATVKILESYRMNWNGEISGLFTPIMAIAILALIKGTKFKGDSKKLWNIDRLCFCVYLVHPVFTNGFYKALKIHPALWKTNVFIVLLFWVGFSASSFFIAFVLYKIKPLKKYVL